MTTDFLIISDYELNEALTPDAVAEINGARASFVIRLAEAGILETIESEEAGKDAEKAAILLPRRAVLQLRQMQRLRRDLGVNFAGASVILELVKKMEEMKREITRARNDFDE